MALSSLSASSAKLRVFYPGDDRPADLFSATARHGPMIQNCCGSHYPFGLHLIWENLITSRGNGTRVNLLVSHDTPQCRVISSLPREGRVQIEMKSPGDLWVRVPDWVELRNVKVSLRGQKVTPEWSEGFIRVRDLHPADVVRTEFPLRHERRSESFMGHTVDVEWLGDTVVSISPEGTLVPLFQRRQTQ